ncbi:MAG: dihydrodipicolinate synthase family protein [Planctomycetota bacterium]
MSSPLLTGAAEPTVFAPLLTPFQGPDLEVDLDWMSRHLDFLRERGVDGVLPLGTNGEFPSLSYRERCAILDHVALEKGSLLTIAGGASPSIQETVAIGRRAAERGFDAFLVPPPYYFKGVDDEEVAAAFRYVLDRVEIPVLLYDFPKQCIIEVSEGVLDRLRGHERLRGIKLSLADPEIVRQRCERYPELAMFVGNDHLLAGGLRDGAAGGITALANWVPQVHRRLLAAHASGADTGDAQAELSRWRSVFEAHPMQGALKYALHTAGLPARHVRPPLRDLTETEKVSLAAELKELGHSTSMS